MISRRLLFHRLASVVWTAFAVVAITAGVIVGLGRLLLPFASQLEPRLEDWLSREFGRPVAIGQLNASWDYLGPELRLVGVRFKNPDTGDTALALAHAQVDVNLLAWLLPDARLLELRVAGTTLHIKRTAEGVRVAGFGGTANGGAGPGVGWFLRQGPVSLLDARVHYTDTVWGWELTLDEVDVRVFNRGATHYFVGQVRAGENHGRLAWRLRFEGDSTDQVFESGRFYVHGMDIALADWLGDLNPGGVAIGGRLGFELWGRLDSGQLQRVRLRLAWEQPALHRVGGPARFEMARFAGRFLWQRRAGGWRLIAEGVDWVRGGERWPVTGYTIRRTGDGWAVGAGYLALADLHALVRVFPGQEAAWRRIVAALQPVGIIRNLAARWSSAPGPLETLALEADLSGVGWQGYGDWPGLAGVSGHVSRRPGSGTLRLQTAALSLYYPQLFRRPVSIQDVEARLAWQRGADGLRLVLSAFHARAAGARVAARGTLVFEPGGGRPFINLRGAVRDGRVARAPRYLPVGIMPAEAVRWLDRALVDGRLDKARLLVYGDLDHWPFDGGQGRFVARGEVSGVTLAYREGWPPLTGAGARIVFEGRSLTVTATEGTALGARVDHATGRIDNLEMALLELEIAAHGAAGDLLRFLKHTPLSREYGDYLRGLRANGAGRVETSLRFPLDDAAGTRKVTGTVWLDGTVLKDVRRNVKLAGVTGRIEFDADGFRATDLAARFHDYPARLSVSVGHFAPDGLRAASTLTGRFPTSVWLTRFPLLAPLRAWVDGAARWQLQVRIPRTAGETSATRVRLASDLVGIGVDLPLPVGKTASERIPFALRTTVPYEGGVVTFHYGERFAAALWPDAPGGFRGGVRFGARNAALPAQPGLVLSGRIQSLRPSAWYDVVAGFAGSGGASVPKRVNLQIARLRALGQVFAHVSVTGRQRSGAWRIKLDGEGVKGTLTLPSDQSRGLVGDFETLVLETTERTGASRSIDPRSVPPLHLIVEEFVFGKAELGRARLETFPIENGLRVQLLRTESDNLGLVAEGTWIVDEQGQQHASFDLTLTAESLGKMLANFGFAGLVEGGSTLADLALHWPGTPFDFALERVAGSMHVEVGPGRLIPVDPGAGQLFGLLSIQALPRRFSLGFSDLFDEGMSFESITGNFEFRKGVAWTDDLVVVAPSARIEMSGRVDLVNRTYNQIVRVYPGVESALPLVGALAAGPPGAAVLFLFQGLFQEQIRELASYSYALIGPWKDPRIVPLESVPARFGPPRAPADGGGEKMDPG